MMDRWTMKMYEWMACRWIDGWTVRWMDGWMRMMA